MNKVTVRLDDYGKGSIAIDGNELKHTVGVKVEAWANTLSLVTITMLAEVDVETPARVQMNAINPQEHARWVEDGIAQATRNPFTE